MLVGNITRYLNRYPPFLITFNRQNFLQVNCDRNKIQCSKMNLNKSDYKVNVSKKKQYKLNIIVVSIDDKKEETLVDKIKDLVDKEKFVVYSVHQDVIGKTLSWMAGCRVLIVPISNGEILNSLCQTNINIFKEKGGEIVNLSSNDRSTLLEALSPYIAQNKDDNLSSTNPNKSEEGYIYSEDGLSIFKSHKCIQDRLRNQGKVDLLFENCEDLQNTNLPTETFVLKEFSDGIEFDIKTYLANLKTRYIGRNLVNLPNVSSSMNVLSGKPYPNGFAVIPDRQTAGEGRGGNRWISPPGCAMFSLQLHLEPGHGIGQTPSLLQHLVGLAAVHAIGSDLEVKLKWPNDIYYKNQVKLGGVVVNSTICGSNFILNIGCGLNLNNSRPTISVNQLQEESTRMQGKQQKIITREEYIARTFNNLESMLDKFSSGLGHEVIQDYHKAWLHSGQRVKILKQKDNQDNTDKKDDIVVDGDEIEVTILGIDAYGYLKVEDDTGAQFSVHDDGNSFDMMNGLIRPKFS